MLRKGIKYIFLLVVLILGGSAGNIYAKKIKNTLIIEKENKKLKSSIPEFEGTEILLRDSLPSSEDSEITSTLKKVSFVGFDKELNSNWESFMIVNPTEYELTGFEIKVEYLDMKGRMFHGRIIKETCDIPPGETRRIDIKTWDTQHTYYYYLGNEPKKVATPFKVKFYPIALWIK